MTKNSITLDVDPTIMENNMRIVKDSPLDEELTKLMSSVDPYPSKLVKPIPGFCVKTFSKPDNKKVFVNICLTDAIPCPRDISNEDLMHILNSEDPSSYRVPMSIGEGRTETDKSGSPATVYDVAINPKFFKKIEKDDLFQTFFLTVVFEGLQDKYQIELDMQKFIKLKNRKAMGTLQSHRIQVRDIQNCEEKMKSPMIEELGDGDTKTEQKEMVYRLRREPCTGEIQYLVAEFKIPPTVEMSVLELEVGGDRLVLECPQFAAADLFLPCAVDQDNIDAHLDRNIDMPMTAAEKQKKNLRKSEK